MKRKDRHSFCLQQHPFFPCQVHEFLVGCTLFSGLTCIIAASVLDLTYSETNIKFKKMKSDLIVAEFSHTQGAMDSLSKKIQDYLNGKNDWNLPINEKDIFHMGYGVSQANQNQKLHEKLLLIHREPA